tara:strand:- start:68788 stop:69378 length:591 start_codon:yes stop_codon:yes gene_type:complete
MSLKAIAVGFIWAIAPFFALAGDETGAFAIKGAGAATCSKVIKSIDERDNISLAYGGWLEGYLTASNLHLKETFDLAPWQSTYLLLKVVESICTKKPDMNLQQAANKLIGELVNQRLVTGGKFVQIGDGATYVFQEEVIIRMKQALKDKGFYSGELNAQYDDATKAAVASFQKSIHDEETGLPGQKTLLYLFQESN